ncbi:glycine cleavage system aminomethyltransferase GcvT [Bacillus piscicola]|uniref:glycine cleavage system aminomethyltransferase GcvT n=1 Tax=Bacillus piscicola TaxID=1632684 RepID=UPI001F097FC3|nr:glycine cleavage system aminomethyltransferase GcvT [Bacillus piscicola]
MSKELKRTPLYPLYTRYGAKTVDFGGWELPVQFSSIKEEHRTVREKAGLFDVSHMGEVEVTGEGAFPFLQYIVTNDLERLKPGKVLYTPICNEKGGVKDDFLIYQLKASHYLLVPNAANAEKVVRWLREQAPDDVTIADRSATYALLAVQGPLAASIIQTMTETDIQDIPFFRFQEKVVVAGIEVLLSRTGYTGEDGFEMYTSHENAPLLWEELLEAGKTKGLLPCGLGARDTLRFEACLPLYGQEISESISPLEAGLTFAVRLKKNSDFIGKSALIEQKKTGLSRKICGIEMMDKGIPRTGYDVLNEDGKRIGLITSGTQSPTFQKNMGLALIETPYTEKGSTLYVRIRKKTLKAVVVPMPFYMRERG